MLIQKVIPAIHEKLFKKDFQEEATKNGFDIQLMCQPPKSPDLNILDLGFCSAIQSLQHKACPKTIEDLVAVVEESFEIYPTKR